MPAAEAAVATLYSDEQNSYEFAFHVLPTVAEGEVPGVFEALKSLITKAQGTIFDEEAPERIDLAYEVGKQIDGKNRKFKSAYFGWVRFRLAAEDLAKLTESIEGESTILRYLIIKLTKVEEANPFKFHENRKSVKMVEVVNEEAETLKEAQTEEEENVEVSEEALDESLQRITGDEEEAK